MLLAERSDTAFRAVECLLFGHWNPTRPAIRDVVACQLIQLILLRLEVSSAMSALSGAGRYGAPAVSAELISRCNFRVPYGHKPSLGVFEQF